MPKIGSQMQITCRCLGHIVEFVHRLLHLHSTGSWRRGVHAPQLFDVELPAKTDVHTLTLNYVHMVQACNPTPPVMVMVPRPACGNGRVSCGNGGVSCIYACMHACMYVFVSMYLCIYVWMHGCMDACMDACMDVCMYVCVRVFHLYRCKTSIYRRGQRCPCHFLCQRS